MLRTLMLWSNDHGDQVATIVDHNCDLMEPENIDKITKQVDVGIDDVYFVELAEDSNPSIWTDMGDELARNFVTMEE